jgi:hypothetical protein
MELRKTTQFFGAVASKDVTQSFGSGAGDNSPILPSITQSSVSNHPTTEISP